MNLRGLHFPIIKEMCQNWMNNEWSNTKESILLQNEISNHKITQKWIDDASKVLFVQNWHRLSWKKVTKMNCKTEFWKKFLYLDMKFCYFNNITTIFNCRGKNLNILMKIVYFFWLNRNCFQSTNNLFC